MHTLTVELGARSYPIHIGPGLLADGSLLRSLVPADQVLIVTNETVAPLYLKKVESAFAGRKRRSLVLPDGEQYKTVDSFVQVIDELIDAGFHRDGCIVAASMRDEKVRDVLAQSWAAVMLGQHPEATRVQVVAQGFQLPPLEEFAQGAKPSWKVVYAAAFDRKGVTP